MSSRRALRTKSNDHLNSRKLQNVPIKKKSSDECGILDIDYRSNRESLELLLVSPSTCSSYKIHFTTFDINEGDSKILNSKKSNKMVNDSKTNDSPPFDESTNVLTTTKPKNKHKDKNYKEQLHGNADRQSSVGKMDKDEKVSKPNFLVKGIGENSSSKNNHKHRRHHSEDAALERDRRKLRKYQATADKNVDDVNEDEDLSAYKRKKKFGVDRSTDPLGYTANLIKNSQLCFVLSTGSHPITIDSKNDSLIKVKGALISAQEKKTSVAHGADSKHHNNVEVISEKKNKTEGLSHFFNKNKMFSKNSVIGDEEIGKNTTKSTNKVQEGDEKKVRSKSKKREQLKSANGTREGSPSRKDGSPSRREKHKRSKVRSLSADTTAEKYMDKQSVENKSFMGDAFKKIKSKNKKRTLSLSNENLKQDRTKTETNKAKDQAVKDAGPKSKKKESEKDSVWSKLKRKNKGEQNSLNSNEANREPEARKNHEETLTDKVKHRHHRSKKKHERNKTDSLCVVTSETQLYSILSKNSNNICLMETNREKILESLKNNKVTIPDASHHKSKKSSKDDNDKCKKATDTNEKKQQKHNERKHNDAEEEADQTVKEHYDDLKQEHRREHRRNDNHHERRKESLTKSRSKSKSKPQSKNLEDITSKSVSSILKKVMTPSKDLNNSRSKEFIISKSDYSVILDKIVSGKHSFNELTSAIEENHFLEALKSGSLLTPKQSVNFESANEKKSYVVTKKQLEVLINYLKCSVEDKSNPLNIDKSLSNGKENKLQRQEISFSQLNLNPVNELYDHGIWNSLNSKNRKQLKRRMPFDQHSVLSDSMTMKEKSQYLAASKLFQNRNVRNYSYSECITERSNRSPRQDKKNSVGFTVEGVEPPLKIRAHVSSINLAKPDTKKALHMTVLSVLEIKPNISNPLTKLNIKSEATLPKEVVVENKREEPVHESKCVLKKQSNTSNNFSIKRVSNVSIAPKPSVGFAREVDVLASPKIGVSMSDSEKSVESKHRIQSKHFSQSQNSKTKFSGSTAHSSDAKKKMQQSSSDSACRKTPEDNRKALKKYSLLSEKQSISEECSGGGSESRSELDKDQLANLGQEVFEMMKKYINITKNEEGKGIDFSSFGEEFLTNVRCCIHERLMPVKEELDIEDRELATNSVNLPKTSSREKFHQELLDSYINNNLVDKKPSPETDQTQSNLQKTQEVKDKNSTTSKESVRVRMANYISSLHDKQKERSSSGAKNRIKSRDSSLKRTSSTLSRDSSRGSLKQSTKKRISEKSLISISSRNGDLQACGSTSSGLSSVSKNGSIDYCKSLDKKMERKYNITESNASTSDGGNSEDHVDKTETKTNPSSDILPKIAEEETSQNSLKESHSNLPKIPPKSRSPFVSKYKPRDRKNVLECKVRRKVSKVEIDEKLKSIAQDMSERVLRALKCTSEDGSATMTADDVSSTASHRSQSPKRKSTFENSKITKIDHVKLSISKPPKTAVSNNPPFREKPDQPPLTKDMQKIDPNKSIPKSKKKNTEKTPSSPSQISDHQSAFNENNLHPLNSVSKNCHLKQKEAEVTKINLQSSENVKLLNQLISKNIENMFGKNSDLGLNIHKEAKVKKSELNIQKQTKNVKEVSPIVKLENVEEGDRKMIIINKLAAAIMDDKIFGNLESKLSKLLDKQGNREIVQKSNDVVTKEQVQVENGEKNKKEEQLRAIKTDEKNKLDDEISESHDSKRTGVEKTSKIPRYTRFGTKSTTSHFGTSSDAGSNFGGAIRPSGLPKPLKKTTNNLKKTQAIKIPNNSTLSNYVDKLPENPKLSSTQEETDGKVMSTFERRKMYSANMRSKKFSSKSEAEFASDECEPCGKPYKVLYVNAEGPSVIPSEALKKYIYGDPEAKKNYKKYFIVDDGQTEKLGNKINSSPSAEVVIQYKPQNDELKISSPVNNLQKKDQESDCEIRNKPSKKGSSVSLFSEDSKFSQEICMHCLTPKAAISLVSIQSTANKEKVYTTRSNSMLNIHSLSSSREVVKQSRFGTRTRRQVSNLTNVLGRNKEILTEFFKTAEGSSNLSIKTMPEKILTQKLDTTKVYQSKSCEKILQNCLIKSAVLEPQSVPKTVFSSDEFCLSSHSNLHLNLKKKFTKRRKPVFSQVTVSSVCVQEKRRKPKTRRTNCSDTKNCHKTLSLPSTKSHYFNLHQPLIKLTKAIKKHNSILSAKLKSFRKPKSDLCNCKSDDDENDGLFTIFTNSSLLKTSKRDFSTSQFFRFKSLTDLDTNYSTTSVSNDIDFNLLQHQEQPTFCCKTFSKNDSINLDESGYETISIKTGYSSQRIQSIDDNILNQFTCGFQNFDAAYSFPIVYDVYPVSEKMPKKLACRNYDDCSQDSDDFDLRRALSRDKGTSPKPNKVRFKQCEVEFKHGHCENKGTSECACTNCSIKLKGKEKTDRPHLLVCRNANCPQNIKAALKQSEANTSDDEVETNNTNTSQGDSSVKCRSAEASPYEKKPFTTLINNNCRCEDPKICMKQSGSIKSGCIPKSNWFNIKGKEKSPSSCSCGTSYECYKKEKKQFQEYSHKMKKESSARKENQYKQFSDFEEIPLRDLLNSNGQSSKDNQKQVSKTNKEEPKLKVLDDDYKEPLESSQKSLKNRGVRKPKPAETSEVSKNLNDLSRESLIDIIKEQFDSSMKNIMKETLIKEVSAQLIKSQSSSVAKDTSVQVIVDSTPITSESVSGLVEEDAELDKNLIQNKPLLNQVSISSKFKNKPSIKALNYLSLKTESPLKQGSTSSKLKKESSPEISSSTLRSESSTNQKSASTSAKKKSLQQTAISKISQTDSLPNETSTCPSKDCTNNTCYKIKSPSSTKKKSTSSTIKTESQSNQKLTSSTSIGKSPLNKTSASSAIKTELLQNKKPSTASSSKSKRKSTISTINSEFPSNKASKLLSLSAEVPPNRISTFTKSKTESQPTSQPGGCRNSKCVISKTETQSSVLAQTISQPGRCRNPTCYIPKSEIQSKQQKEANTNPDFESSPSYSSNKKSSMLSGEIIEDSKATKTESINKLVQENEELGNAPYKPSSTLSLKSELPPKNQSENKQLDNAPFISPSTLSLKSEPIFSQTSYGSNKKSSTLNEIIIIDSQATKPESVNDPIQENKELDSVPNKPPSTLLLKSEPPPNQISNTSILNSEFLPRQTSTSVLETAQPSSNKLSSLMESKTELQQATQPKISNNSIKDSRKGVTNSSLQIPEESSPYLGSKSSNINGKKTLTVGDEIAEDVKDTDRKPINKFVQEDKEFEETPYQSPSTLQELKAQSSSNRRTSISAINTRNLPNQTSITSIINTNTSQNGISITSILKNGSIYINQTKSCKNPTCSSQNLESLECAQQKALEPNLDLTLKPETTSTSVQTFEDLDNKKDENKNDIVQENQAESSFSTLTEANQTSISSPLKTEYELNEASTLKTDLQLTKSPEGCKNPTCCCLNSKFLEETPQAALESNQDSTPLPNQTLSTSISNTKASRNQISISSILKNSFQSAGLPKSCKYPTCSGQESKVLEQIPPNQISTSTTWENKSSPNQALTYSTSQTEFQLSTPSKICQNPTCSNAKVTSPEQTPQVALKPNLGLEVRAEVLPNQTLAATTMQTESSSNQALTYSSSQTKLELITSSQICQSPTCSNSKVILSKQIPQVALKPNIGLEVGAEPLPNQTLASSFMQTESPSNQTLTYSTSQTKLRLTNPSQEYQNPQAALELNVSMEVRAPQNQVLSLSTLQSQSPSNQKLAYSTSQAKLQLSIPSKTCQNTTCSSSKTTSPEQAPQVPLDLKPDLTLRTDSSPNQTSALQTDLQLTTPQRICKNPTCASLNVTPLEQAPLAALEPDTGLSSTASYSNPKETSFIVTSEIKDSDTLCEYVQEELNQVLYKLISSSLSLKVKPTPKQTSDPLSKVKPWFATPAEDCTIITCSKRNTQSSERAPKVAMESVEPSIHNASTSSLKNKRPANQTSGCSSGECTIPTCYKRKSVSIDQTPQVVEEPVPDSNTSNGGSNRASFADSLVENDEDSLRRLLQQEFSQLLRKFPSLASTLETESQENRTSTLSSPRLSLTEPEPNPRLIPNTEAQTTNTPERYSSYSSASYNKRTASSEEFPQAVVESNFDPNLTTSNNTIKNIYNNAKKASLEESESNYDYFDFQGMPKKTLLKIKEQIDKCLNESNDQTRSNRSSKKSGEFPFNNNPSENKPTVGLLQVPFENKKFSNEPYCGLPTSLNPAFYSNLANLTNVPLPSLPSLPNASSHALFLESYWGNNNNNENIMALPAPVPKPLLMPNENYAPSNSREHFTSPEDIPSKEQSFKKLSLQQLLQDSYPEKKRSESKRNFSLQNLLQRTLNELELINSTKQSLEMSSQKLSTQLKNLSTKLSMKTKVEEDSNTTITTSHAQETSQKNPLNSSLKENILGASKKSHRKSKRKPKNELSGAAHSSRSGKSKNSKSLLKEEKNQQSVSNKENIHSEVLPNKPIISSSSLSDRSQESVQSVSPVCSDLTTDEKKTESDSSIKTGETLSEPSETYAIVNPSMVYHDNNLAEIVQYSTVLETVDLSSDTGQNNQAALAVQPQTSSEVIVSNLSDKSDDSISEGGSSTENVQESDHDYKSSLSYLMDLIEIKSEELLNSSPESLVVSLDEINIMSETNPSPEDLSKKLGVLFKTSMVKLLDMNHESVKEEQTIMLIRETFRNTVEALLNDVIDEASNRVSQQNLINKTKRFSNDDLYQVMFCSFTNEHEENPFEKQIDTISKVAIVMLVQKISCANRHRRSDPIPDHLLLDLARVSLQAIIETYKKMYSRNEINVSFKTMVEEICKHKRLGKKLKRDLTGSQMEVVNTVNKKNVSDHNTSNIKNCLCSPIKDNLTAPDMSQQPPLGRRSVNIKLPDEEKSLVSEKPVTKQKSVVHEKTNIIPEKVKASAGSKFLSVHDASSVYKEPLATAKTELLEKSHHKKSPVPKMFSTYTKPITSEKSLANEKLIVQDKPLEYAAKQISAYKKQPTSEKHRSHKENELRDQLKEPASNKSSSYEKSTKDNPSSHEKFLGDDKHGSHKQHEVRDKLTDSVHDKSSSHGKALKLQEKAPTEKPSVGKHRINENHGISLLTKLSRDKSPTQKDFSARKTSPVHDKLFSKEKSLITVPSARAKPLTTKKVVIKESSGFQPKSPTHEKSSTHQKEVEIGKPLTQKKSLDNLLPKSPTNSKPPTKSDSKSKSKPQLKTVKSTTSESSKFSASRRSVSDRNAMKALNNLREKMTDKEVFEKLLDSYEKEERIVDRLSKDDLFFQNQLEQVKSKESIESIIQTFSKQNSDPDMLLTPEIENESNLTTHNFIKLSTKLSNLLQPESKPSTELAKNTAKKTTANEKSNKQKSLDKKIIGKAGKPRVSSPKLETEPVPNVKEEQKGKKFSIQNSKKKLRSSLEKLSKVNIFGKNAKKLADVSKEKFLAKYDYDKASKAKDSKSSKSISSKTSTSKDVKAKKSKHAEDSEEKLLYKYNFDKDSSNSVKKPSIPPNKLDKRTFLEKFKKNENNVKEIVAPRHEDRSSVNELYSSKHVARDSLDDEQKVKFGDGKKKKTRSVYREDFLNVDSEDLSKYARNASVSSLTGDNRVKPEELGKCFLRGFRPDNIALSGDTCLKISDQEEQQRRLNPNLYKSPPIDFSERDTPLDFLLALGFSIDEASNAIKDEDVKNRLLAAVTEARIWINKITAVQGTLLYLTAYKAKPKIMRYFLQLVEAIINRRINDAVKLDGFLRVLEKVEDGDLEMIAILGSEKLADDDNDEKMVRKQLREIFITVYKIAENESALRRKPLSTNAIMLLRILAAKYRAGLHPHLELIAKYIGQGLLQSGVQLEAAMIYLARLDTAYVDLEEFEEYIAISCSSKTAKQ